MHLKSVEGDEKLAKRHPGDTCQAAQMPPLTPSTAKGSSRCQSYGCCGCPSKGSLGHRPGALRRDKTHGPEARYGNLGPQSISLPAAFPLRLLRSQGSAACDRSSNDRCWAHHQPVRFPAPELRSLTSSFLRRRALPPFNLNGEFPGSRLPTKPSAAPFSATLFGTAAIIESDKNTADQWSAVFQVNIKVYDETKE